VLSRLLILAALIALAGCDQSGGGGGSGGASSSGSSPAANSPAPAILAPFQGEWRFSLPKTIARWQADSVAPAEIAEAQAVAKQMPLHPDMQIQNDTAILPGVVEGSYQFFALHPHPQWLCGKAWHHEDRHDPGDMDKYFVRLQLRGPDLHLSVRIHDDAADPSDPDVTTMPLTAGSAATCPADPAPTPPWSPWRTYVFERRAPSER
jgi:hypothetical protein